MGCLQSAKGTRIDWNYRGFRKKIGGGSSSPLYTWYAPFSTPVQDNIERDGTEYYWPLDDATPNVSVVNYAGAKTLTKTGAGTAIAVTNFDFNESSKAVLYDGSVYHEVADVGTSLGTQDIYMEFDFRNIGDPYFGVISQGNAVDGWAVLLFGTASGSSTMRVYLYNGGVPKTLAFNTPYFIDRNTRHRCKIEIDRDNAANMKCYIDGISCGLNSQDITDYSATSIGGTSFYIGRDNPSGHTAIGEISQVKIVYGSYTGSTTPAFNKGLTPTVGATSPTFTRATLATGINEVYNPNGSYVHTQLVGNPVISLPDPSKPLASGIYVDNNCINYLLRSRELDNVAWTPANITVTANQVAGPDGVILADKLVSTAANGTLINATGTAAANKYITASLLLRANAGTFTSSDVVLGLDDTGHAGATEALLDADTGLEISAANSNEIGTDWRRVYVYKAFGAVGGNIELTVKMITNALTIYADMGQAEARVTGNVSSQPTGFIYTTSATVTRNTTQLTCNVSELSNKMTVLMMVAPTMDETTLVANNSFLFNINSDLGLTWARFKPNAVQFRYFGTDMADVATTWTPYNWYCVGIVVDTDADEYWLVWDGTLQTKQTTVKATPTYTSCYIGGYDASYGSELIISQLRFYKNKALTQAQITAEYNDMKTKMGL